MNLIRQNTPNKWVGGNLCRVILIHWWDDPAKNPTLDGVIAHFLNPAVQVSAHYVVSGDTVVQMCEERDRAWHAIKANNFAIGIEVDPKTPGNTYRTLGELVRAIRLRHGNIPLEPHNKYASTQCPGTIDLARIDKEANQGDSNMDHGFNKPNATAAVAKIYKNVTGVMPTDQQLAKWVDLFVKDANYVDDLVTELEVSEKGRAYQFKAQHYDEDVAKAGGEAQRQLSVIKEANNIMHS